MATLALGLPVDCAVRVSDGSLVAGCSALTGDVWDGQLVLASLPSLGHVAKRRVRCGVTSLAAFDGGDGARLAVGRDDGQLAIHRVNNGSSDAASGGAGPRPLDDVGLLRGHESTATAVAAGSDCKLVSASWDGTVKAWDARAMSLQASLDYHVGAVNAVDLADNGTASLLASGGEDGCVLAADLRCAPRASSPQAAVRLASGVTSLCFAAGGDPVLYAATESGALSLVDLRNPQHPLQLPSTLAPAHALLPLGDGRVLVGADDGSLSVVDARTSCVLSTTQGCGGEYVRALAPVGASEDGGSRVAVGGWNCALRVVTVGRNGTVQTPPEGATA